LTTDQYGSPACPWVTMMIFRLARPAGALALVACPPRQATSDTISTASDAASTARASGA